jgi:hypothetical protein
MAEEQTCEVGYKLTPLTYLCLIIEYNEYKV